MPVGPIAPKKSLAHLKTDPLRNFRFRAQINHPGIPQFIEMGFMSVSGLSVTTEVIPYREGGMNTTAQPLDAKIHTPEGYKVMGELKIGDAVSDPLGEESNVTGIFPWGTLSVFRVRLRDGSETRATAQHLWSVEVNGNSAEVLRTREILELMDNGRNVCVPALDQRLGLTVRNDREREIEAIILDGEAEVQCIEVSAASHLYITDGDIPTHNTQKLPGQSDFAPITLSKGLAIGETAMMDWMKELFYVMQGDGTRAASANDFRHDIDIWIMDHPVTKGATPIKAHFTVRNAWPTAISFSDLDAGANSVMINQMTLAHEGFEFEMAKTLGAESL